MTVRDFIDTMDSTIRNQVWIEITGKREKCLDRSSPKPENGWVISEKVLEREILKWSIVMGNYGISSINLKVK